MKRIFLPTLGLLLFLFVTANAQKHQAEPKDVSGGSVYLFTDLPSEGKAGSFLGGRIVGGDELRKTPALQRGQITIWKKATLQMRVAVYTDVRTGRLGSVSHKVKPGVISLELQAWHEGPLYRNVIPGQLLSQPVVLEGLTGRYEVLVGGVSVGVVEFTEE